MTQKKRIISEDEHYWENLGFVWHNL
jgi:hypothetical protein